MIHVFNEDNEWSVWSDCDDGPTQTGRCIGVGKTQVAALADARIELLANLEQVKRLRAECESQPSKNPSPAA